ncbi:unknown protein [Simkania negevensis Z]|uniref:Uncharacterized protein n=1 Tax=Simkania negevensis (strain ATCC VR-1471 / DSM 27360 / Z) TaxID=331113 RepID=F8L786_SIMNZ|nr:unknown protein [Simkania negevensis Z]
MSFPASQFVVFGENILFFYFFAKRVFADIFIYLKQE